MLLAPGNTAIAIFQARLGGSPASLTGASAIVFRGSIATAIPTVITTPAIGLCFVSFVVPQSWDDYDLVLCSLTATVQGKPVSLTKVVGVVLQIASASLTEEVSARLGELFKRQGLISGIGATQQNPTDTAAGYLRTSDGAIDQSLTKNPDGSITIARLP